MTEEVEQAQGQTADRIVEHGEQQDEQGRDRLLDLAVAGSILMYEVLRRSLDRG